MHTQRDRRHRPSAGDTCDLDLLIAAGDAAVYRVDGQFARGEHHRTGSSALADEDLQPGGERDEGNLHPALTPVVDPLMLTGIPQLRDWRSSVRRQP